MAARNSIELHVAELLVSWLSPVVRVAAASILENTAGLTPVECARAAELGDQRALEFATGRVLARSVLAHWGHSGFSLLPDADRVPIWPEGVVGSISHKRDICIVAVASREDRAGIGVDIEHDAPVKSGVEELVCLPSERRWLEAEGASQVGRRCRLVFSAKEAVYKAFYPSVRTRWGFHDVEVLVDLGAGRFDARLPAGAHPSTISGRIACRGGWVVSAVEFT
jgi:4'-phosphopantetheinyl transferase EntD